jgi:hypothetical protein
VQVTTYRSSPYIFMTVICVLWCYMMPSKIERNKLYIYSMILWKNYADLRFPRPKKLDNYWLSWNNDSKMKIKICHRSTRMLLSSRVADLNVAAITSILYAAFTYIHVAILPFYYRHIAAGTAPPNLSLALSFRNVTMQQFTTSYPGMDTINRTSVYSVVRLRINHTTFLFLTSRLLWVFEMSQCSNLPLVTQEWTLSIGLVYTLLSDLGLTTQLFFWHDSFTILCMLICANYSTIPGCLFKQDNIE